MVIIMIGIVGFQLNKTSRSILRADILLCKGKRTLKPGDFGLLNDSFQSIPDLNRPNEGAAIEGAAIECAVVGLLS